MKKTLLLGMLLLGISYAGSPKISHSHSDYENGFITKSEFSGGLKSEVYIMNISAKRYATILLEKYDLLFKGGLILENYRSDIYLDAAISSVNESIEFGTTQIINSEDTEFSFSWDSRIKSAYTSHKMRVGADLYPNATWSPFLFLSHKTKPAYLRQGIGIKYTFLKHKDIFPGKNSLSWAFVLDEGVYTSSWRHKINFKGDIFQFKRTQFLLNGECLIKSLVKITPALGKGVKASIGYKYVLDENEETYSVKSALKFKKTYGIEFENKFKGVQATELSLWVAATEKIKIEYSTDVYDGAKTQTIGFEVQL